MRTLIFLTLMILGLDCFAGKRFPTNVPDQGFMLEVRFGEQITKFAVWSDKGGKFYSGLSNQKNTTSQLSDKNYQFLMDEVDKVSKLPSYTVIGCPSQNISLSFGKKVTSACIETSSETAQSMKRLANMLSLLL